MEFTYRGIAYNSTEPTIETTETQQTGLFLGRTFKIKQYNVAQRHSQSTHLKYRGVDYDR